MTKFRGCAILAALLASSIFLFASSFFSVEVSTYRYAQADLLALEKFPYDDWKSVLGEFVNAEGRVDYEGLLEKRDALDRFVALVAAVGPRSRPDLFRSEQQQLAYYLNAYNALVLFNVLVHWPLESPHDIRRRFFYGTRFVLDGRKANLYELENLLIREEFNEPRVHFVLNCASLGSPRLGLIPLYPETLDDQLAAAVTEFLNEERNLQKSGDELILSELFDWYADDFAPDVVAWINAQRPDLDLQAGIPTRLRDWDWRLNSQ